MKNVPLEVPTTRKVVIVDDDKVILGVAGQLLRAAGFEVATYAGKTERLNFIVREEPDLLLIDVNMPFLQGNKIVDLMKQDDRLSRIPVVFFSSDEDADLQLLVTETGAQGFIRKCDVNTGFSARVSRFIDAPRSL